MSRIVLALAVVGIGLIARRARKEAEELRRRLALAAPYLVRSGARFEEIEPLLDGSVWIELGNGGNTSPGRIGNLDSCPCQSEYTVASNPVVLNAWPNPAAVAACAANPPLPRAAEWQCTGDCVQVMTHLWHGWRAVQNLITAQIVLYCYTFAQYHCKKPDDPDRDKPPEPTDPNHVEG